MVGVMTPDGHMGGKGKGEGKQTRYIDLISTVATLFSNFFPKKYPVIGKETFVVNIVFLC